MNLKQQLFNAIERKSTDKLPFTTNHLMPSFLNCFMGGIYNQEFFGRFGLGGFDQYYFSTGCSEVAILKEVLRCFEAVGKNGGFKLLFSDHSFDADLKLIPAFADEAKHYSYS